MRARRDPARRALIARGLPPGAGVAGLLLGAATNRAGLALLARAYGTAAMMAVITVALAIATATGIAIQLADVAPTGAPPLPYDGPVTLIAAGLLGLAAIRGLWRYGLAAWLEPLHGGDHHHHQHAAGAPCEVGCHDH